MRMLLAGVMSLMSVASSVEATEFRFRLGAGAEPPAGSLPLEDDEGQVGAFFSCGPSGPNGGSSVPVAASVLGAAPSVQPDLSASPIDWGIGADFQIACGYAGHSPYAGVRHHSNDVPFSAIVDEDTVVLSRSPVLIARIVHYQEQEQFLAGVYEEDKTTLTFEGDIMQAFVAEGVGMVRSAGQVHGGMFVLRPTSTRPDGVNVFRVDWRPYMMVPTGEHVTDFRGCSSGTEVSQYENYGAIDIRQWLEVTTSPDRPMQRLREEFHGVTRNTILYSNCA